MFIPFAGQWINPAHITRMEYLEGKRLTICLADAAPALTEKGEKADMLFKAIATNSHPNTFKGIPIEWLDTLPEATLPPVEIAPKPKGRRK